MKKILLTLILGMFLLTAACCLVSAEPAYVFKQYEDVEFSIAVFNSDNSQVTALTTCYFTLKDPDLNILIEDQQMNYSSNGNFNYTISGSSLSVLGEYPSIVRCDDGADYAFSSFIIEITTTGKDTNPTFVIIILVIAFGLFLIALLIKNHATGFIAGVLMVISGVNILIYGLTYLNDMYTRSIALVVLGFGLFIIMISGLEWLEEMD